MIRLSQLKLELIYGHTLATRLRRLGLGPEIVMRRSGLPEIKSLQPLTRRFAKSGVSVITAARAAESKRATKEGATGRVDDGFMATNPRSRLPRHPNKALIDRQQKLADRMRGPKPRAADDPVKLTHEAERWTKELSNVEYRGLVNLLDGVDQTNSRRQVVLVREGAPPPVREIVQEASYHIPEGSKTTGPALFRSAVVVSAGRHAWNDLLAETKEKMKRRKKALERIKAQNEADSIAIAEAESQRANRTVVLRAPVLPQTTEPATPMVAPSTGTVAPDDASVVYSPEKEVTITPARPRGRRGR